jgi:hypothetical protein
VIQELEPGARRDAAPPAPLGARRHVVDPAAGEAGEVVVRAGVAVEAQPAGVGALGQEALGGEHAEIAINGGETHPGKPAPHPLIDEGRRRVSVGRADHVEDEPARSRQSEPAGAQRVEAFVVRNHYQLLHRRSVHTERARVKRLAVLARPADFQ